MCLSLINNNNTNFEHWIIKLLLSVTFRILVGVRLGKILTVNSQYL